MQDHNRDESKVRTHLYLFHLFLMVFLFSQPDMLRANLDVAGPPTQALGPPRAFYAQVWCTYRAGFEPIRDLSFPSSLPSPLILYEGAAGVAR